jgi:hypothetical protein
VRESDREGEDVSESMTGPGSVADEQKALLQLLGMFTEYPGATGLSHLMGLVLRDAARQRLARDTTEENAQALYESMDARELRQMLFAFRADAFRNGARVAELEAERDAWKKAAHDALGDVERATSILARCVDGPQLLSADSRGAPR